MRSYVVNWECEVVADSPEEAAVQAQLKQRDQIQDPNCNAQFLVVGLDANNRGKVDFVSVCNGVAKKVD